jgi:hemoglobin-like flavoprotein
VTPEQKTLVKASYQRLVPMADTTAYLFYTRLFELDPSLRALFKVDFREQTAKFMDMLRVMVSELENPNRLEPALRELGIRHAGYGVLTAYYDTVGEALLWAIAKALGREAEPELKEAWSAFYNLVADIMKQAARTQS